MLRYPCPMCGFRVCDSNKFLKLEQLTENNLNSADMIVKCQKCKNRLAVNVKGELLKFGNIDLMSEGA